MIRFHLSFLLACLCFLNGCAKNPVTGQQELHLFSQTKEIKMGEENYLVGQQSSGGIYQLDPELTAYVQKVGHQLAQVSDRPDLPYDFVVLNDSVPNAWALPGGKIAINRGLLTHLNNEAELAAVLGHEITHAAARHGAKSMERQMVLTTALTATNVALGATASSKGDQLRNTALMAGATVAAGWTATKYSRSAELEADAYGMQYMVRAGYDPKAAVSLQQTFVKLSENKSSNWLDGLFASHPPSQERVIANQARAQSMPQHLELGEARYQQKIAKLKQSATAYAAFDKGKEALAKGDTPKALTYVNEALALEPKEALFHGLKGDILSKQNHSNDALAAYNQAIQYNDSYFYFYHQRGLLLKHLGQNHKAKADLTIAQKLLPTESADLALKQLS